ncbi:MAG: PHP domain-containing protein [Peptostreptococcaceae bacterium]|jgi:putative hydrolase|nr:PHP domain-containing protein [Peptostreptococcaceae bacterium]
MNIIKDYHTHTVYSHGLGSIEDNVKVAIEKGLKTIGISDHGYKHIGFGIKYDDIKKMKEEIDILNEKYSQIEILLGVEANILDDKGNIDVDDYMLNYLDYVMAGYHFGSTPTNFKSLSAHVGNYIKPFKKNFVKYNTNAVVNAMKNNDLLAITHPGSKGTVDILEVSKASIITNTALEINSSHSHLNMEELKLLKDIENLKFIIGSDAHKPLDVGNFEKAIKRVKESKLDMKKIINAEVF